MFSALAQCYDLFFSDEERDRWAAQALSRIFEACPTVKTVHDAACGTGAFTRRLYRRGLVPSASDLSEDMLRVAADRLKGRVPLSEQSLCALTLPKPVDLVTIFCDGVNYVTEGLDFTSVYNALRPGGVLWFDVSSVHKLERTLGDNTFVREADGAVCCWRNHYSPRTRRLQMDLTVFTREANGLYRRADETQVQRAYSEAELRAALSAFASVTAYYGAAMSPHKTPTADRIHFLAIR
ncbi:MAG: class I SAM-dependent methyltransferase [Clostridiales bacterium]|jgi:SAM-dependent methyltransferase|nr:class I SAM-dependent methyltransferase [Clostridiales bacterium]